MAFRTVAYEDDVVPSKIGVVRLKGTEDEMYHERIAHPKTSDEASGKAVEELSEKDSIEISTTSNITTGSEETTAASRPSTRTDHTITGTILTSSEESKSPTRAEFLKLQCDPIRWFGLVVPTALRTAQNQFTTIISDSIPDLTNLSIELQFLEIEIGRARKKLLKANTGPKDVKASRHSMAINQQP